MFFLHPFHKSVSTHIPIHLVSVRNKKGKGVSLGYIPFVHSKHCRKLIWQYPENQSWAGVKRPALICPRCVHWYSQINGSLISHRKTPEEIAHIVWRIECVTPCPYIVAHTSLFSARYWKPNILLGCPFPDYFMVHRIQVIILCLYKYR